MLSNKPEPRSKVDGSKITSKMYHKEMLLQHIIRPLYHAFDGTFDYLFAKIVIAAAGIPAGFALDLFETPEFWWKGLLYLVLFDWIGGIIAAIKQGAFDWNVATRKWYQVTGYTLVCASSAVISTAFPEVFYYFQFAVYATFFLKEFVSILRTWRVLTVFEVVWEMIGDGSLSLEGFQAFRKEVDKRAENPKTVHYDEKS